MTGAVDIAKALWHLDKATERHKGQEVLKIKINLHVIIAHHLLGKGSGFSSHCLLHTHSSFQTHVSQEEGTTLANTLYEENVDHFVEETMDIISGGEDLMAKGKDLKAGEAEWKFIDFGML